MAKKKVQTKKMNCNIKNSCGGCSGFGYFMGFIGAAVYYISTATGFWVGVLGVLKAIVWPAFVVFELLKFLGCDDVPLTTVTKKKFKLVHESPEAVSNWDELLKEMEKRNVSRYYVTR